MGEKLELLKKLFQEYNYNKYKDIDLNSLICYVSNLLEANGIILTFENIYVGSYISFPLKFCLVEFPEFPDGARINRSILQCLPKYQNLLMGNAKKGYKLTTYGLIKAKDVAKRLSKDSEVISTDLTDYNIEARTVDVNTKIKHLFEKVAFKKFAQQKQEEIQADEIFDFLDLAPFDHKKKIQDKLYKLDNLAKIGHSQQLIGFMNWLKKSKVLRLYLEV